MSINKSLPTGSRTFVPTSIATARERTYTDIDLTLETMEGVVFLDSDENPISSLRGDVYKKKEAAAVTQAIKTLLLTNKNEKPFQPDFGANLERLLFDNTESYTEGDISEIIKQSISQFEPRANVSRIYIRDNPDRNEITITVVFTILNREDYITFTTVLNRLR